MQFQWPIKFNKPEPVKEVDTVVFTMEPPVFVGGERETIDLFLKSESFQKIRKYLISQLLSNMLHKEFNESFKQGWISCIQAMTEMPVGPNPDEEEEDNKETPYTDEL